MDNRINKISIITPVYKAKNFIKKCIESVLAQTYDNWELLLIDDGSPDSSGAICDSYSESDSRVITYHKKNGGVSSARNEGLKNANGDWFLFLDSDDWLDEKCLETCLKIANINNLDLLQFAFEKVFSDGSKISFIKNGTIKLDREEYVKSGNYNLCACGTFVKSEVVKNNAIAFDETLKLAEDQLFIMKCISYSKMIMYIPDILYYYYQNQESATHHQKSEDMLRTCDVIIDYVRVLPLFKCHSDNLIIDFITSIIENADVSRKCVLNVYYDARINMYSQNRFKAKLFYTIAKVSPNMAYWIVRSLS